jgi:1-acyl-sn-glycerol-3-phosphate acyltransferase
MTPAELSTAIWLRSWIYLVAFVSWTVVAGLSGLPTLMWRGGARGLIRTWVRGIMWLSRTIVRIDGRVEGCEHLPAGPCIVAAQHQSSYETYRLFLVLERPVFVLKRELTWIPVVGWYMRRAGLVPIDRGAGARAMRQMLRAADAALARGDQVVIFPEGTRTPRGAHKPYRPGVMALYAHCDVPLVPMALNSGPLWGKTRILKLPGEILFRFLPPMPRGLDKDQFLAELRARLESAGLPDPAQKPI